MHVSPFAGLRDCSDRVFGHFFQILSSRCLQRNSRNIVYFLKHKHVLRSSQSSFNPGLAARATMTLSRAQNI